jgi:hypothetical protein
MDGCQLLVRVGQQPRHTLVTVAGEIDIVTAPRRLRGPLTPPAAAGQPVVVDPPRSRSSTRPGSACWPARPGRPVAGPADVHADRPGPARPRQAGLPAAAGPDKTPTEVTG